jgi:membrane-bound lytic murein transglycosylase C
MKRTFTYGLLCGVLAFGLSSPHFAMAKTDWLDDMDQQFEETFVKSDQAFDRAMQEGVEELDQELNLIWGNARQLPEPKVWVGYSKDKKTRIIVDYDKGEMSFEGLDVSQDKLEAEFKKTLNQDSDFLNERDVLRRKLIDKVDEYWRDNRIRKSSPRLRPQKKATVRWTESQELTKLVEPHPRVQFVKRDVVVSQGRVAQLSRLSVPLRENRDVLSAQILRNPVIEMAQKYNLSRALILSVIKNESAFNPRAHSSANALGLMQLVPNSGGKEAYSYLMGQEAVPALEILYDPIENIKLGATYLHLLNTRYFGKVRDEQSRLYLMVAAYNTGAGNVSKAFTGEMKLNPAIEKINRMSSEEVYQHLIAYLPYDETKTYLKRVTRDTKTFADWDDTA